MAQYGRWESSQSLRLMARFDVLLTPSQDLTSPAMMVVAHVLMVPASLRSLECSQGSVTYLSAWQRWHPRDTRLLWQCHVLGR